MFRELSYQKRGYEDHHQHLADYFSLLDLMLLKIFIEEEHRNRSDHPLKGMVITPDEVQGLFDSTFAPVEHPDIQKLVPLIQNKIKWIEHTERATAQKLPLIHASEVLDLGPWGPFLLVLGLAIHDHPKYERIFGYLNDNVMRKYPTFDILTRALDSEPEDLRKMRKKFAEGAYQNNAFMEWSGSNTEESFYSREIKLHKVLVSYLLGQHHYSGSFATVHPHKEGHPPLMVGNQDILQQLLKANASTAETAVYILQGEDGIGRRHLLKALAYETNQLLLEARMSYWVQNQEFLDAAIREMLVCHKIYRGIVALVVDESFSEGTELYRLLKKIVQSFIGLKIPVFIVTHSFTERLRTLEAPVVRFEIPLPGYNERHRYWSNQLKDIVIERNVVSDLAGKFIFTPKQIEDAALQYRLAIQSGLITTVYEAAKDQVKGHLGEKAIKIQPAFCWEQLILPEEQQSVLKSVCSHVEHRHQVYSEWGFEKTVPYGQGTAVIFAGPPGTGKTMAAQVLSNALKLDLYKIDLSQMVSKYIGETEKNLHGIFQEAKLSNAILFFDEADALFGKRSEVKDAKDRYANIEVAYLLQKIEEYQGITLLATNFLNNIDKAFLRRIRFIIDFPFPDMDARRKIWAVSVPEKTPLGSDVDFEYLARTFEVSGGNIKNILINSAFFAAEKKQAITMKEIIRSAKYELQKMDKLLLREDLKEYGGLL